MSKRFILGLMLCSLLYSTSLLSQDDHDHVADTHNKSDDAHEKDQDHGKHENHEEHEKNEEHNEHDGHEGDGDEHSDEVHLRPEQIKTLGLKTLILEARELGELLQAPGEVRLNQYLSDRVSPRVSAQVIKRHVQLGEEVKKDQTLVTLSSVQMAEAQGEAVIAGREWERVRKLGRKVVSESRYLEAQITSQQAKAKALAYGMTEKQVAQLLKSGASRADGTFQLLAPRSGTVVSDDFIVGEIVEPGRPLFEITDESMRWVEASFPVADASKVLVGNDTRINIGDEWMTGHVKQIHHMIDESTRTRAIRIEVSDPDHHLHPGQFVSVVIESGKGKPVLALPESAVLRSPDGDWQVFVAGDEPGAFKPVEVARITATGGLAIIEGIIPGTEVVTEGAFFLASELAKGGFDPHNH